ncbi:hypothetical protein BpHYR1_019854 [Brachionus plicatilis]|uniref:Uncharacterized protein n=1 Tax=Brachionus plicatilis TaxID=10195 RepID=A0A3M7R3C0_BRAPC|nr:hypothetical protein BpHYR1_019854 [Brachionus plicatilis]
MKIHKSCNWVRVRTADSLICPNEPTSHLFVLKIRILLFERKKLRLSTTRRKQFFSSQVLGKKLLIIFKVTLLTFYVAIK